MAAAGREGEEGGRSERVWVLGAEAGSGFQVGPGWQSERIWWLAYMRVPLEPKHDLEGRRRQNIEGEGEGEGEARSSSPSSKILDFCASRIPHHLNESVRYPS
jgi:hypothetical protein